MGRESLVSAVKDARCALDAGRERLEKNSIRLRETLDSLNGEQGRQRLLHDSRYARLYARFESMPVIEQAKGIMMARSGIGPDEAFDILRRASQRTNVRVKDLAADIVAKAAKPKNDQPESDPEAPSVTAEKPTREGLGRCRRPSASSAA